MLAQFLSSLKEEQYQTFLSYDLMAKESDEDKLLAVAVVQSNINLIGTILELPKIVLAAKKQIEMNAVRFKNLKEAQED